MLNLLLSIFHFEYFTSFILQSWECFWCSLTATSPIHFSSFVFYYTVLSCSISHRDSSSALHHLSLIFFRRVAMLLLELPRVLREHAENISLIFLNCEHSRFIWKIVAASYFLLVRGEHKLWRWDLGFYLLAGFRRYLTFWGAIKIFLLWMKKTECFCCCCWIWRLSNSRFQHMFCVLKTERILETSIFWARRLSFRTLVLLLSCEIYRTVQIEILNSFRLILTFQKATENGVVCENSFIST